MILFFGDGRLGNQLFQYAFIKSVEKKQHLIVSYNFDEISELFDSVQKIKNIQNHYLKFAIRWFGFPLFDFLSKTRIISSYKVKKYYPDDNLFEDTSYCFQKGLLPISYFYPCFAQSEKFFDPIAIENLNIKKVYTEKAKSFLETLPKNNNKVFVHVRRGDYIHYSVLGKKAATLPLSYYKIQIKWFEENIENPFFIFLTDDPEFVEYCFQEVKNKVISNNSIFVDFAVMTWCEYGILSNSSFSWWGAYMMKNRKKVFAPKYWLGWKSGVEFQRGISPSFAEIVEVNN